MTKERVLCMLGTSKCLDSAKILIRSTIGFTILPIECVLNLIYATMASNLTILAQGSEDVRFHSIFTEEIRPDEETPPTGYCAIHTLDKPLEFFNE